MKKQLFLAILSFFYTGCLAASNNNFSTSSSGNSSSSSSNNNNINTKKHAIILQSKDGKTIKFSKDIAKRSPMLKELLELGLKSEKNEPMLTTIKSINTLNMIHDLLNIEDHAKDITKQENFVETTLKSTIFLTKSILQTNETKIEFVKDLIEATLYFDLDGPAAQAIATTAHRMGYFFKDLSLLNQRVKELCKAFCKNYCLDRNKVYNTCCHELSIQDLLNHNKCPKPTPENDHGVRGLNLSEKNLTSLEGLNNIPDIAKFNHEIDLSHNRLTKITGNDLKIVNEYLSNIDLLEFSTIDLSYNQIHQFELPIKKATKQMILNRKYPWDKLREINLSHNFLKQVPQVIIELYEKSKIRSDTIKELWKKFDDGTSDEPEVDWDEEDMYVFNLSNNAIASIPKDLTKVVDFAQVNLKSQRTNLKSLVKYSIARQKLNYSNVPFILAKPILKKQIKANKHDEGAHITKKLLKHNEATSKQMSFLKEAWSTSLVHGNKYKVKPEQKKAFETLPTIDQKYSHHFIMPKKNEMEEYFLQKHNYFLNDSAIDAHNKKHDKAHACSNSLMQDDQPKRGQKRKKNASLTKQQMALLKTDPKKAKKQKLLNKPQLCNSQVRQLQELIDVFNQLIINGLSQNNNNFDTQTLLSTHEKIDKKCSLKAEEVVSSKEFNTFFNKLIEKGMQDTLIKLNRLWCKNPKHLKLFTQTFKKTN